VDDTPPDKRTIFFHEFEFRHGKSLLVSAIYPPGLYTTKSYIYSLDRYALATERGNLVLSPVSEAERQSARVLPHTQRRVDGTAENGQPFFYHSIDRNAVGRRLCTQAAALFKAGDDVVVRVEGIGELRNPVVAETDQIV
jgi:hypothetical protein